MIKYTTRNKSHIDAHWETCIIASKPYVSIKNRIKFAEVCFDAFPMLQNYDLIGDPSIDLITSYSKYVKSTNLPSIQIKCTGGSISLNFTVWKKDAQTFANSIYDFIEAFVMTNRVKLAPTFLEHYYEVKNKSV